MMLLGVLTILPAMLVLAAAYDLATRRIPNGISLALAGGFCLNAVVFGLPPTAILLHLAVAAAVLAVSFGAFMANWLGGGDAKLAAATALWLGADALPDFLILMALLGGALALLALLMRAVRARRRLQTKGSAQGLPYGVAIAAAGCVAFPLSDLWRLAIG